jgi:ABC-type glycerol-3-phosphate transport system substrate-binding protein
MKKFLIAGILALAVTAILAGCGSSSPSSHSASVVVSGTDAPLAVRVAGLVVKNPANGAPITLARRVVALR